jgi:hypothetical protein
MKNFRFLAVVFAAWVMGMGIYSCQKDSALHQKQESNLTLSTPLSTESRTSASNSASMPGCPNINVDVEVTYTSPCSFATFRYLGTDDPNSTCTIKDFEVKVFEINDPESILQWVSFTNEWGEQVVDSKTEVRTDGINFIFVDGGIVTPTLQPYASYSHTLPVNTNANSHLSLTISNIWNGEQKVWICYNIDLECDGELCSYKDCEVVTLACI